MGDCKAVGFNFLVRRGCTSWLKIKSRNACVKNFGIGEMCLYIMLFSVNDAKNTPNKTKYRDGKSLSNLIRSS